MKKQKQIRSKYREMTIDVPKDRNNSFNAIESLNITYPSIKSST